MINIAVLGYGTVGSGVVEVINTNQAIVSKKAGQDIHVKYVLDLRNFPGDPIQEKIVHDFDVILKDPEIKIVAEVMGGIEPAYTFVKKCLLAGKSVTTSNKALVAQHGAELLAIASENKVNFLFEASVGGGIPIIRPLNTSITADEVEEVTGILNGTTNYMMTKMFYEGANYDEVLKEAQEKGYAERNPEADVEGHDACRKIAILTSIIAGKQVDFEEIYTEGITKVSVDDMKYAKALGMTIKLLATMKNKDGKISAIVAPFMLGNAHPLYSVNDVFNAIYIEGNVLGPVMFYGSGAGKLPTASAVVSDIVDIANNLNENVMAMWSGDKLALENKENISNKYFVRILGEVGELGTAVSAAFGEVEMVDLEEVTGEFAFVTGEMTEGEYMEKAAGFAGIKGMIRIA